MLSATESQVELILTATATNPKITDKAVKSENNSQVLIAYSRNLFDGVSFLHANEWDITNSDFLNTLP